VRQANSISLDAGLIFHQDLAWDNGWAIPQFLTDAGSTLAIEFGTQDGTHNALTLTPGLRIVMVGGRPKKPECFPR
jgi:hypothetical protein